MAFHEVLRLNLLKWRSITGGHEGIALIPAFQIGSIDFGMVSKIPNYYLGLAIFFVVAIILYQILNSKIGLILVAMRDSDSYARSRGVNPYKYKLIVFFITSFFTGIIGGYYTHYMQVISPEILNLGTLFTIIAMLIIGGLGNFYGPIIGAFFLTFLSEYTRDIGPSRFLIVGLAVVIILIIMPKGLVVIGESIKSRITRRVR